MARLPLCYQPFDGIGRVFCASLDCASHPREKPLMSHYVDSIVVPVPKAKLDAYKAMSARSGAIWKEHGALQYWEAVADDIKPGKVTSFPQAVQLKDDETVVVAWVVFASRAERDRIMEKVMADPRLADMMDPANQPFDGQRMFWGGFEVLIDI